MSIPPNGGPGDRGIAYSDRPWSIGYGQTISQPSLVAYMTELLELKEGDRVLEVGTGSGYQAAILAELPGIEVYTVEIVPELAERARTKLEALGYTASPVSQRQRPNSDSSASGAVMGATQEEEQNRRGQAEIHRKLLLLILGIVLTLPVVILSMFFPNSFPGENYLLLALTTPVWAVVGWEFHRGAIKNLRHRSANMDTLISLGTGVSLLTGPASFVFPVANYAGVSAMIMAFHLTGRYVEETAKGRASQAIRKLLELGAKTARILVDGDEVEVPINQVAVDA